MSSNRLYFIHSGHRKNNSNVGSHSFKRLCRLQATLLTGCSSLVIDSFLTGLESSHDDPILYFYYKDDHSRTADECLRSLVRQLIQLDQPGQRQALEQMYSTGRQLRWEKLVSLIKEFVKKYGSVVFVIDALDKCARKHGRESHSNIDLLSILVDIMKSAEGRIKLFISTVERSTHINQTLDGLVAAQMSADDQPRDDIEAFVWKTVNDWLPRYFLPEVSSKGREDAKLEVIDVITERAGSMYAYFTLHLIFVILSLFLPSIAPKSHYSVPIC